MSSLKNALIAWSLVAWSFCASSWGDSGSLILSVRTQVLPSTTVAVAEPFRIVISVSGNRKIFFSSAPVLSLEKFDFLKADRTDPEKSVDDQWQSKIVIELLPITMGETVFPSLALSYATKEKTGQVLQSPPVKLKVVNPIGEEADPAMLRDIKAPVQVSPAVLIGTLFLLLVSAAAAFWIFKRHRKPAGQEPVPQEVVRPPDELASEELALVLEQYRRDGNVKILYSRLSFIFRKYVSGRYHLDAIEKTTSEIFSEMRKSGIDRKITLDSKDILSICDLVKFAKFIPSEKQIGEDIGKLKLFIENTKQSPQSPPSSERAGDLSQEKLAGTRS